MTTLIVDIETAAQQLDVEQIAYLGDKVNEAALHPITGQVACIGVQSLTTGFIRTLANVPRGSYFVSSAPTTCGCEATILREFWDMAKTATRIVTFNGRAFDIPFMVMRSAMLGVPVTKRNLLGYRYSVDPHCDLLDQLTWYGATRRFSLAMYCKAFGIENPKGECSGADVPKMFVDGRHAEIAEYNLRDVRATAALYKVWLERISSGVK